jgi:hypothetical protein
MRNYLKLSWKSTTYEGSQRIRRRQGYGGEEAAKTRKSRKKARLGSTSASACYGVARDNKPLHFKDQAHKRHHNCIIPCITGTANEKSNYFRGPVQTDSCWELDQPAIPYGF